MTSLDIITIQASLGIGLPDPVKQFLLHKDSIPAILQDDFFSDIGTLISKNVALRGHGYYHLPWPIYFFAVGNDPGDCVYYFDLSNQPCPVFFADHDYDDPSEFEKLADSPAEFIDYLKRLGEDFEQQEKNIR